MLSYDCLPYERQFSRFCTTFMLQYLLPFLSYNTKGWFWLCLVILRPKRKQICEKIEKFYILAPKTGFLRKNVANLAYFWFLTFQSSLFQSISAHFSPKWPGDVYMIVPNTIQLAKCVYANLKSQSEPTCKCISVLVHFVLLDAHDSACPYPRSTSLYSNGLGMHVSSFSHS